MIDEGEKKGDGKEVAKTYTYTISHLHHGPLVLQRAMRSLASKRGHRRLVHCARYRAQRSVTRLVTRLRVFALPGLESRLQESCGFPGSTSAGLHLRGHACVVHSTVSVPTTS